MLLRIFFFWDRETKYKLWIDPYLSKAISYPIIEIFIPLNPKFQKSNILNIFYSRSFPRTNH